MSLILLPIGIVLVMIGLWIVFKIGDVVYELRGIHRALDDGFTIVARVIVKEHAND